jgi:DNA excision repair protein ERCC-6
MDDEEQTILSSLLAKLQDQGEYEDDVLRNARHEMAPRLTGIGLPIPIEEDFGNFDLPLIHNLLTKIRRQIQQLLQNSSSSSTNQTEKNLHMLYMKEQILLHVALEKSSGEFALRLDEERKMEQARSLKLRTQQQQQQQQQLQQQQQQQKIPAKSHDMDDDEKMQKKRVQFQADAEEPLPAAAKIAMSRKRVPMMKRKRIVVDDDDAVSEEENQRGKPKMDTQQLKALREQRTQRIRNSRRTCRRRQQDQPGSSSESTCSDEDENEMEFELDEDAVVTATPSLQRKDATGDDSHHTEAMHVTCPICQEQITVDSSSMESDPDSILAQHMAACQTKPPRRTTRTRGNRSATGSNTEDAATTSTSTRTNLRKGSNDANVSKKNTRQKRNRAIPGRQQFLKPNIAIDDYDEIDYEDRVDNWIESGLARMKEMKERDLTETLPGEVEYPGGLYIPAWINDRLFGYQREGLRWMWELHQQEAGGILGDMMGLGKTVQIAAFLGAMACSRQLKSVLIVSPATLLQHWLSELATWAPGLRRILIHSSGGESNNDGFVSRNVSSKLLKDLAFWLKNARSNRVNEAIDDEDLETYPAHSFCGTGYIIVTTYENLRRNADIYQNHDWSYLVLDEAQKIRNPDADITLACKRIRTPHRIAMTGTPIQNDLRELWSIMDFCFPGRLGTLPAFEQEFAIPIKRGGYSNATPTQVQLAYRCAIMLRDLIEPFLLRRLKKDVKEVSRMPGKTEHVLFCRLSQRQRQMYEAYLQSDDVARVLKGNAQIFAAVTMLRKITNHPDLVCDPDEKCFESFVRNAGGQHITSSDGSDDSGDEYVDHDETLTERSGKLEILSKILPLWHKQGHRVIIFSQWCKMLNIIERFLTMKGWKFGRLDGNTNIASRQRLVDAFNTDDSYFAMLCTTRTGGVGLNLTGANRIILYDPDWNPSSKYRLSC